MWIMKEENFTSGLRPVTHKSLQKWWSSTSHQHSFHKIYTLYGQSCLVSPCFGWYSWSFGGRTWWKRNIFIFAWFSKHKYYLFSYSVEVWKPNSINFTQSLNFKVSVEIKAQKTQYAIFCVLSVDIFCLLMFLYW